jgi:hypothetical protein
MKTALLSGLVAALVLGAAAVAWSSLEETAAAPQPAAAPQAATPADAAAASPTTPANSSTAAAPAETPADAKAREDAVRSARELGRVKRTLASTRRQPLVFEQTSLKDALSLMAEMGKFGIVVDPELKERGTDLESQVVTLKMTGLSYEQALMLMLPRELGYRVGPGYVLITTLEKSWLPLKVATYSIMMVLAEVPNFEGPRFDIQSLTSSSAGGQGNVGQLFQNAPVETETEGKASPEKIIDMITKFVRHENDRRIAPWSDEGGPASIQYLGGRLIISQTEEGHRAVERVLAKLGA